MSALRVDGLGKLFKLIFMVTGALAVLFVMRSGKKYGQEGEFHAGYGCSEASTLGDITENLIEDNTRGFTGNHLMAPEVVPGILLVNRKLNTDGHDLTDLTVSLLHHFGLPPGEGMTGQSIFDN